MQSRMIVTVAVMNATNSGGITPCTTIMSAKVIAVNIYIYIYITSLNGSQSLP